MRDVGLQSCFVNLVWLLHNPVHRHPLFLEHHGIPRLLRPWPEQHYVASFPSGISSRWMVCMHGRLAWNGNTVRLRLEHRGMWVWMVWAYLQKCVWQFDPTTQQHQVHPDISMITMCSIGNEPRFSKPQSLKFLSFLNSWIWCTVVVLVGHVVSLPTPSPMCSPPVASLQGNRCPENTFSEELNAASCKSCPVNTTTGGPLSTSLWDCKCEAGRYFSACFGPLNL